ncbi:MAG: hypothetical protein IPL32_18730 [Chloracidobacterium sp.]|nr:hypothetical protein [Chloracidobacterium sp.]
MWQPIETAPRDGTEILAYSEIGNTGCMLVRWIALQDFITTQEAEEFSNIGMSESALEVPDWFFADFCHGDRLSPDCYPTHWMPIPAIPERS